MAAGTIGYKVSETMQGKTEQGAVIDLSNPTAPIPAGRFADGGTNCILASRSSTRLMMLCPDRSPGGSLFMLGNA